ncbi:insulinase family protein [Elioraea tepida]|uniref:Insulinase family protein n=1 Tax=Elioraea tepida TaxID=2843330 RepID=A0A975YIF2_9PROT|nr:pitrilysin family protein [Elioraea tepida]QXM23348.1 insulinase family protein [Elioraea tepida]
MPGDRRDLPDTAPPSPHLPPTSISAEAGEGLARRPLLLGGLAGAALAGLPRVGNAETALPSRPRADERVFGAETFTLANGMQGVVIPMRRAPVVAHMVWYRVGAADESQGHSGLAHFLEHLMFKGTPSVPAGQFSRRIAREGGRDNAFTGHDYTAYFQQVASDRLPLVMAMEADRMVNLLLDEKDIAPERLVVVEERRQVVENNPRSRFRERLAAVFYVNSPYGRPVIGWEDEIRAIDRESLLAFYKRFYLPANAIVVVQGDVDVETVRRLAEDTYGQIPSGPAPVRARPQEPPALGQTRLTLRDSPRVREPSMTRLYRAPSARAGQEMADALDVAAHLLGSGPTSILWRALVETGLAASVGAYYNGETVDRTEFSLFASPRPGVPPERVEAALDAAVARTLEEGVTQAEVERSARQLTAGAALARDSLMDGARAIGAALAVGLPLASVEAWPKRIREVTAEAVTAALRAVLDEEGSATGWLLPQAGSRA